MNETSHILARLDALERKTEHLDPDIKAQIKTQQHMTMTLEGKTRRKRLQQAARCRV